MEGIIKEEEKSNQQPQENKKEKDNQNDKNKEVKKTEKYEEEKKEEKQEKEKVNQEKNEIKKDSKVSKEEKEHKQVKKNEFEKKIKEKIFIYFIGNHEENYPSDFELDKSEFASDLEILSEDKFPVNNISYKYSIYRFKISNFKPEDKIKVKIKLKYKINNKIYEAKIDIKDFNFDFDFDLFLYDIKFKSNPPQYYKFSDQDTFRIYTKYLRSKKLNQKSEENINLILSTIKFIICQKNMNFLFILKYSWSALQLQFQ